MMEPIQRIPRAATWRHHVIAAVMLLGYLFLATGSSWNQSCTYDEIAHITAGLSYWQTGDYRLNPENGLLPQRWAALPLWMQSQKIDTNLTRWWSTSDVWRLGKDLFLRQGTAPEKILRPSRFMIVLLGTVLGLVIYGWSNHLFGPVGGLLSLLLYVTNPAMLAAGSLVTSDMTVTLFFLLAVTSLWHVLHRLTPWTLLLSVLAIAGLILSKVSGVLIVPMTLLMLVIRLVAGQPLQCSLGRWQRSLTSRLSVLASLSVAAGLCAIGVYLLVWLAYGSRYSINAQPEDFRTYLGTWETILKNTGVVGSVSEFFRTHHLLPEAYLYGVVAVQAFAKRIAFLDGQWSVTGFPWFFPITVLYKTPVALFACLGLSAAVAGYFLRSRPTATPDAAQENVRPSSRWREVARWVYVTTPLWVLFVVFWAAVLPSKLNIGHRHVLPTYPTLIILAGAAACWWTVSLRIGRTLVLGLGLLAIVELGTIYPHCISFFNVIAGGPSQGYRHLVDSSLDWGQDLPGLAQWIEQNAPAGPQRPPVYVSYFGTAMPENYRLQAIILPSYGWDILPRVPPKWEPGIYCVSATMLQGVYLHPPGPWTSENEAQYHPARIWAEEFAQQIAPLSWDEQKPRLNQAADRLRLVEGFRHARMCHFLRQREPDARVGYSILIYFLNAQDLQQIELGPTGPLPSYQDAVRGVPKYR